MNANRNIVLWFLLIGNGVLSQSSLVAESKEGPWESLFNGKDLSGWVPMYDVTFEVREGNLRLVKGTGWLRTEKEYKDFILEFECRALEEKYDSGIFFRVGLEGKPWPTNGWQLNLRYDALAGLVRGYRPVVPSETSKIPVNQWGKYRLEVKGKKVAVDVNGERAWEADVLDRESGYLGIQVEGKSFDFRNLRIQLLGATDPPKPK